MFKRSKDSKPVDSNEPLEFEDDDNSDVSDNEGESKLSDTQAELLQTAGRPEGMCWDFREGTLPPGVEVIGAEPEFVLQQDGSTALLLPPMSYLTIAFADQDSAKHSSFGGKLINDYTLTMDILLERLPAESMSLFQSSGDAGRSEGEAFVYGTGGVGVFGEVGVAEAGVRPGRWNRVVVTLGDKEQEVDKKADKRSKANFRQTMSRRARGLGRGRGASEDHDEEEDPDGESKLMDPSSNMYSASGTSWGGRGMDVERVMCSYVNSRKCATISSKTRGVLKEKDGRFAINTQGITVFGSNRPESMSGGKLIRYLEVRPGALSESDVRQQGYNNRLYNTWEKERQAEIQARQKQLTLKPIYKNPPPFWMHPLLVATFGDAFLEGTGLEGGDLATSTAAFELVLDRLLKELTMCRERQQQADNMEEGAGVPSLTGGSTAEKISSILQEFEFSHDELQSLNYLYVAFQTTKSLCKRYELAKKNGAPQLVHYYKVLKKALAGLKEGEMLIVPGGIGDTTVIYIVEKEDSGAFRFCVVNTDPNGGLDWHSCTPEHSPHIHYQVVLAVKDVTPQKMLDDAFWGILLKLAIIPAKENRPDKLYNLLLPFLVDKPSEQILSESETDVYIDMRLPQRSSTAYVRCVLETSHFVLRRKGITAARCRQLMFAIELQLISLLRHDLTFMPSIGNNERKIIAMACAELARNGASLGHQQDLSVSQMKLLNSVVVEIDNIAQTLPCDDADASASQPEVFLEDGPVSSASKQESNLLFPLLDRVRRTDDVNGLAGPPIVLPKYVPIDFLQIPITVKSLDDVIAAIRYCDRLCTLISVQKHCVKNRPLLKVSVIEQTFVRVLPVPRAPSAEDFGACVWQTPMSYSIQLDIAICLGRLMEHFISSAFSLHNTKSLDALKLIITGSIAAMLDATLRKVATDQPSEFCLRYLGERWGGRGKGFGLSMAAFDTQSETIELHTPELSVARAAVLDYFSHQKSLTKIFNWQDGHHFDENSAEFLASLCGDLAFPADGKSLIGYMITGNQLINKNYPEFHILRDISFYVKYVQNVDPRAFPPQKEYSQMSVELKWDFQQSFEVEAFTRGFPMKCYPDPPFTGNTFRYPSASLPSNLASPHEITSEDDVLHIKNLPGFDGCLGQQDSELLLSFLTVPYLRIPLVLSFFSTEDRIHALKSEELQGVLDSVLFEPARFLHADVFGEPEEVPCVDKAHMATSHGLIINEIHRSPSVFIDCTNKLLSLSMDLDVGTFHSMTVPIILYILRLASRIESFISFMIDHGSGKHESIDCKLRTINLEESTLLTLQVGLNKMRYLMRARLHPMLEAWCAELSADCDALKTEDDAVIDTNTRSACQLHAHMLLLYRNLKFEDFSFESASTITSSFMFLTTRHTWNMNLLGIPEHEIFEMLSVQRRNLINWTRSQPQDVLNALMEATIRVTVGTGGRSKGADPMLVDANRMWAYLNGPRSIGRFSVASTRRMGTGARAVGAAVPVIRDDVELGIEIDLQTVQLTLKSSHLKALDNQIAGDPDVLTVFGKKSMQGSITESTVNRVCVNLIGRGHTIHFWQTPDDRSCVQDFDRDYSPSEVEDSEQWIVPIFEPVRMTYMTQPFVLQVCMPEIPLSPDAEVACLVGIHPKNGGTWKKIFVFKKLQLVHVYNVTSHGRRFYRVLEYTSNCKLSLREMQPSLDDRRSPWPLWERHGAGHPYGDHWGVPTSSVITRGWDYEQNLSGGEETYLPPRLLYGLVPQALLDTHMFWQDERDNIRGYANDKTSPYFIYIELVDVDRVECLGVKGTCGRIRRVLKGPVEERMKKQMDLLAIIDSAHMVNEKDWKVNLDFLDRLGAIVDYGCSKHEITEFIEALQISGVVYEQLEEMLGEIEAFAMEQGVGGMEVVDSPGSSPSGKVASQSLEHAELSLVCTLYALEDSKFASVVRCLSRVENIGNALCWTRSTLHSTTPHGVRTVTPPGPIPIDMLEMPRLKMAFCEKRDEDGNKRLYSMDHSHLFVCNFRSALTARLMTGLPHSLLMSSSTNELQILVPAVDPVRPRIGSSPFTTELVMNRNEADEWNACLDTFYYLYPIHVSLSFLFSPTLSSGLYMLLARFLARNYEEVFRLAGTIGTDTDLSPEEDLLLQALGRSNSDCHPDAHACRMKISLVTLDAPITCPWDLTRQCSRYITKLSHVSLVCRLTLEEEFQLLQQCVCDSDDPRFYNAKGQPKYTLYEVTLVKNRKHYLEAVLVLKTSEAKAFTVPRQQGTRWTVDRNMAAMMLDTDSFAGMEIHYAAPATLSGHAFLEVVGRFWGEKEDSTGSQQMGFLFLYELLTGTKTAKILNQDMSRSLAILLAEMLSDRNEQTLLPSILSLLCRVPFLTKLMPKYNDTRTFKNNTVKATPDEREPISPLGTLLTEIMEVLQLQISEILADYNTWEDHPVDPPAVCRVLALEQIAWTVPVISDFSCGLRVLAEIKPELCVTRGIHPSLAVSQAQLDDFAGLPLNPLGLGEYTTFVSRADCDMQRVDDTLPFDVSQHRQAKTAVAMTMLFRLEKDVQDYAEEQNSSQMPKCAFLVDAYTALGLKSPQAMKFNRYPQGSSEGVTLPSRTALAELIRDITAMRQRDEEYVQVALHWLVDAANTVSLTDVTQSGTAEEIPGEDAERARISFLLQRFCRQEASIWLEFLFASVLSSQQFTDLARLNPFINSDTVESITDVIVSTVLHANRISHANRCILDARELDKTLTGIEQLQVLVSTPNYSKSSATKLTHELGAALSLKDESLGRNLNMQRHYIHKKAIVGGEEKRQRVEMTYDPRYLLFEFTWSILLRKTQVEIVNEYLSNLAQGVSTVKQMIMGAGKTTIVCPLLTLMLGDGQNLVVQVVPPALLELSRAVMRSTFSSIMHKRIFTLNFDRSSEADPTIYKKLTSSIQTRGVVITTPTTIKSMMLKFLEWMYILNDVNSPRSTMMEADCQELGRVLQLFRDAVLIMDEVDLILHPMKSELNFPIGTRVELDYSPQRWQMPIHLLDAIFYAEYGRISVGFKQSTRAKNILEKLKCVIEEGYKLRALQRNPHIVLLNTEWYHQSLKPVMAEWLYMWIETQHMAALSELHTIQYLLEGASSTHNPQLAELIESCVSFEHKKMLNLGRDWLLSFLPHVLQKIDRVSFGLMNKGDYERAIKTDPHMPRTRAKLAIPFVGKDVPSKSSEFAHPDVIIGLTILAYRYEGLRWTDFEDIISNLRSTMTKEIGPFKLRKSSMRYSGWVRDAGGFVKGEQGVTGSVAAAGEDGLVDSMEEEAVSGAVAVEYNSAQEVVPLRLLKRSNEDQMNKIFSLLQNHPDTIHFYLENFIFPAHMDSKVLKLSAAGQELGGEMLFKRRIGFSGTPSDLLPVELGRCGYEKGSDGQMIHVMTSPTVCSYEVVPPTWSPRSILRRICTAPDDMRFHALIDTGALITGMTNLEVATFLLQNGLSWCEGVVFLDDYDRKMVLVRSTGRVLKMAQCGIKSEQRFAFYDQVHTTGMDIQHTLNARAVLTLSKDMVFRDYAQGAYRMRGINKGQTIHLMIIPEVCDLISRELRKIGATSLISEAVDRVCGISPSLPENGKSAEMAPVLSTEYEANHVQQILRDVNAWLVINSMRSERVQFNQLCIQNVSNVWRKTAYNTLLAEHKQFTVDKVPSRDSAEGRSLQVFCENINFALNATVPTPTPFGESIVRRVEMHSDFVQDGCKHPVVTEVLSLIAMSTDASETVAGQDYDEQDHERLLGAEMVQEQEQEKEQQQEQEQEQEIEIEKYVDLAYSREHEAQTPWKFSSLASPLVEILRDGGLLTSSGHPEQFYSASEFKLIKRDPLEFPHHMLVSSNYFDLRWSGARRIKNVIMTLDWVPSIDALLPREQSLEPLTESQEETLLTALSLYDSSNQGVLTIRDFEQVLRAAGHHSDISGSHLEALARQCTGGVYSSDNDTAFIPIAALRDILVKGRLSRVQGGRRVVAVSLAEAETIRRIIHLKNGTEGGGKGNWLINGSNVAVGLRCISAGNIFTDTSRNFVGAEDVDANGSHFPYTSLSAYEAFRYLNCDMYFSEKSLNILIRALHHTSRRERKNFFKNILMCRRRLSKKWSSSPIAKIFTLADQFAMLKQRALSACMSCAIKRKGMLLYDAFCKFDFSHNGYLTPGEVWGGFHFLEIPVGAQDVLDFVNAADTDNDGLLSFREFVDILQDPDKSTLTDSDASGSGVYSPDATPRDQRAVSEVAQGEGDGMLDDDLITLDAPVMQRQVSLTPVAPRGEDELRLLRAQQRAQEQEDENEAESAEEARERKIREELEAEEDEKDRQQEGGRNPSISDDMVRFNFTTGRLPRRLKTSGDVNYSPDEVVGEFLKILPSSSLLLSIPFHDNCGGRRLNQYTVTMEIKWTPPPLAEATLPPAPPRGCFSFPGLPVPGIFGVPDQSQATWDMLEGTEGVEEVAESYWPLFAIAAGPSLSMSAAARANVKAQLWCDQKGRLHTMNGICSMGSSTSNCLQNGKWHHISVVVDCVCGEMEVYLDGSCVHFKGSDSAENRLKPEGIDNIDGVYSVGGEIYLFGDGKRVAHVASSDGNAVATAGGSSGGGIRHFSLHPRCLHFSEVSELTSALKQERKMQVENLVSVYLQGMGMEAGIAAWAAREAEGSTIEEKINSVLNLMPGALGGGGGEGMMGGDMDMGMGGYGGGF